MPAPRTQLPSSSTLKPPKYKRIQRNQIICRQPQPLHPDAVHVCDCKPQNRGGKSCTEDCLNAAIHVECLPGHCPCGAECQNQRIQRRQNAPTRLVHMGAAGWGLRASEAIPAGSFVIEYTGEVVNIAQAEQRAAAYEKAGLQHTYIMNLRGDEVIDATAKGSEARYINHSCGPNCETQKWQVGSELCVGIFAMREIAAGEEITYSYNLDWNGGRRVRCCCGAPNCVGFLGGHTKSFQDALLREVAGLAAEDADTEPAEDALPDFDSDAEASPAKALSAVVVNGGFAVTTVTAAAVASARGETAATASVTVAAVSSGRGPLQTPQATAAEQVHQSTNGKAAGKRSGRRQSQVPARANKRQPLSPQSALRKKQSLSKAAVARTHSMVAYCRKGQGRKQSADADTDALAMYDSE